MQMEARTGIALAVGLGTHLLFALGVGWMVVSLAFGMQTGLGRLRGAAAWTANAALVLQFPLLHSFLLSRRGRRLLARLFPPPLGEDLSTTTYAAISSLQILATFALWSPSGVVWAAPRSAWLVASLVAYAASWLTLGRAMSDAGLGVQTGAIGWRAVVRGERPRFEGFFPERGLFRVCRQPVYVAFALTLWTGPWWTPDRLAIALAWTAYCAVGPVLKEERYLAAYGDLFRRYQQRVRYWLPSLELLRPSSR
jgi:protein-S-isoprenylcysteine O-methyltransferase Ste14